jgi:hypothetical protein
MSDDIEHAYKLTKNEIRSKIFDSKNKIYKSTVVMFFGTKLELRQPSLKDVMGEEDLPEGVKQDPLEKALSVLLKYAYVPGTDDKVFDISDIESLGELPFGEDFNNAVTEFNKLANVNVDKTEKK